MEGMVTSFSDFILLDIDTPPAAPTGLTAVAHTDSVALTWNIVAESDLHAYRIYRDTSSPASTVLDSVVAQSPPDTFYTDGNVVNGTTYFYRVLTLDQVGNESPLSDEVSATPEPRDDPGERALGPRKPGARPHAPG